MEVFIFLLSEATRLGQSKNKKTTLTLGRMKESEERPRVSLSGGGDT